MKLLPVGFYRWNWWRFILVIPCSSRRDAWEMCFLCHRLAARSSMRRETFQPSLQNHDTMVCPSLTKGLPRARANTDGGWRRNPIGWSWWTEPTPGSLWSHVCFKCYSNTNNPVGKIKSAIKTCNLDGWVQAIPAVTTRNALIMVSSRCMLQPSLIMALEGFGFFFCRVHQGLNSGWFSLLSRKQREKHCVMFNVLENGCSLVSRDG